MCIRDRQDSIGLKSWLAFAAGAGVAEEGPFLECLGREAIHGRVDKAVAFADKLGVNATPTVMISKWLLNRIPVGDELLEAIEAVQAGRRPGAR